MGQRNHAALKRDHYRKPMKSDEHWCTRCYGDWHPGAWPRGGAAIASIIATIIQTHRALQRRSVSCFPESIC